MPESLARLYLFVSFSRVHSLCFQCISTTTVENSKLSTSSWLQPEPRVRRGLDGELFVTAT